MAAGGKKHGKVSINDTDLPATGQSRSFMARDSAASEMSVQRVLYVGDTKGRLTPTRSIRPRLSFILPR